MYNDPADDIDLENSETTPPRNSAPIEASTYASGVAPPAFVAARYVRNPPDIAWRDDRNGLSDDVGQTEMPATEFVDAVGCDSHESPQIRVCKFE